MPGEEEDMKAVVPFVTSLALAVALPCAASQGGRPLSRRITTRVQSAFTPEQIIAQLMLFYSMEEIAEGVYIGSEFCAACHPGADGWRDTGHSRFLRRPETAYSLIPGKGVIADADGNGVDDFIQGLDFNQITSPFDPYKPNAPSLSVHDGRYWITIGELSMPVAFTLGGTEDQEQEYVVRIPVADTPDGLSWGHYFAPLTYQPINEITGAGGWMPNQPANWYDGGDAPRYGAGVTSADLGSDAQGNNYDVTCAGCHTTGVRSVSRMASGEWYYRPYPAILPGYQDPAYFDFDHDGQLDLVDIGCESCHGPGSSHILGGPDPEKIVDPLTVDAQRANDICGRCHTMPESVPNGLFPWPYDDATMTDWNPTTAAPLASYYTDVAVNWPDGKTGHISRPYHDFYNSPKPTFQFHMVRCYECHDAHDATQDAQIVTSIEAEGIDIPTSADNDTLCLACHASHGPWADLTPEEIADFDDSFVHIREVVEGHTHHPWGAERRLGLSRCTTCHMAPMSGFGQLSTPSHTFEAVPPQKTLVYQPEGGMPNACAVSCHSARVDVFGIGVDPNPDNTVWNEPFDRALAELLMRYYGPEGVWWERDITQEDQP